MLSKEPKLVLIKATKLKSFGRRRSNSFWFPEGIRFGKRYTTKHIYTKRLYILWLLTLLFLSFLIYNFLAYEYQILHICHNNIHRQQIRYDKNGEIEERDQLDRRLPKCIIIGVRKCGTRALLEFLSIHPSVKKASDEVHFFDDNSKYSLGFDWYRKQMPYSLPNEVTIEKSPAYFVTDSVPQRIYQMNASTKLIIIVRDPVTRLVSDYAQLAANKANKNRQMASFEDLILVNGDKINTSYKAIRIGIYAMFYSRWTQVFPKSQVHVVDGDRLVYDPFPEVQKVEQFLGLSHRISRENFSYNSTKGFFCVRFNGTSDKCLNESKGRRHPQIDPQVIQRLRRFYASHNRLFLSIGR